MKSKEYKRSLIKYIKKEESSYDSYQFPEIIMMMLKRRLDYYTQGDNVWQCEDSQAKMIKSLTKAVSLGESAMNAENFQFEDEKDWFKNCEKGPLTEFPKHTSEEIISMFEKEVKAYKKWFSYIGEHFDEWWD